MTQAPAPTRRARASVRTRTAKAVIDTCRAMNAAGINQGKAGNISVRWRDGMLITPTGMPYDALKPSDIVTLDAEGAPAGRRSPSSEWRMHHDIYRAFPEAAAVLHAHPINCTAIACLGEGIPAFHYMVAMAGGPTIRCAPYATFGTQELSDGMIKALKGRKACLLANHGMICWEATLEKALALAIEVETLAAQYRAARQLGNPKLLKRKQMNEVLKKFETYGRQPEGTEET